MLGFSQAQMMGAVVGFAAIFAARKISAVEQVLDKTSVTSRSQNLIPAAIPAKDGYPLTAALAPAVVAFVVNKYL